MDQSNKGIANKKESDRGIYMSSERPRANSNNYLWMHHASFAFVSPLFAMCQCYPGNVFNHHHVQRFPVRRHEVEQVFERLA